MVDHESRYSDSAMPRLELSALPWREISLDLRCKIMGSVGHEIAAQMDSLLAASRSAVRTDDAETLSAELIPFCDALRWLARTGPHILKNRRVGAWRRPLWLWGVTSQVTRIPYGQVLVLGTWNYPLFLPGVQVAQALAAGNEVLWKPAPGCEDVTQRLAACFYAAGIPRKVLQVLDSDPQTGADALDAGVDLVILTGSATTGRKVLAKAAASLTPCIVELSGCDAMIVLPSANLETVTRGVRFGLTFNGGATCIGPRRLLVADSIAADLRNRLHSELAEWPNIFVHPAARSEVARNVDLALQQGAIDLFERWNRSDFEATGTMPPLVLDHVSPDSEAMQADLFAPLISFCCWQQIDEAIAWTNSCPYALSASVFGTTSEARRVAEMLRVGNVTINDLIIPTADPRLPFGGCRDSGFGTTRGPEGLLQLTIPKVISIRKSGPTPHLDPPHPANHEILAGVLQYQHAKLFSERRSGLRRLLRGVRLSRK